MKTTWITAVLCSMMALLSLRAQEAPDCPCCSQEYRSFDFWIGEWEVTLANGSPAGTNRIGSIQDGCVLQEHWKSVRQGVTGTSFTYYNQRLREWEQLWVDNSGNVLKLRGGPEGNAMVLSSDPFPGPEGSPVINRITWTPMADGSVRQLWELLGEGTVVQVLFDGYYRKKPD
ncbi:MAG: hypothetical protein P8Z38_05790 [Robiginitalea sp.]